MAPVSELENLVKVGKLDAEPPDQEEFDGMGLTLSILFR